ncbi:MAG: hypothetical protein KBC17_02505 [Candidatus Pacebacteria bacterium]|nr:hypothetical protein [Candidatus Paceibacterota bacterium]
MKTSVEIIIAICCVLVPAIIVLLMYKEDTSHDSSHGNEDPHKAGGTAPDPHAEHPKGMDIYKAIVIVALFIGTAFVSMIIWESLTGTRNFKNSEFKLWTNGKFFDMVPVKNQGAEQQSGNSDNQQTNNAGSSKASEVEYKTVFSTGAGLGVGADEFFSVELNDGERLVDTVIGASTFWAKFAQSKEEAEKMEWVLCGDGGKVKGNFPYKIYRPMEGSKTHMRVKYTFMSTQEGALPKITLGKFKTE